MSFDPLRTSPVTVVVAGEEGRIGSVVACLRQHNVRVIDVRSGHDALHAIDDSDPDVVLAEPSLTVDDDEPLIEAIAEDEDFVVPVIALTTDDATQISRAISLGAQDHITAPFHEPTLVARVDGAKTIKRLRDEVNHQRETLSRLASVDALTGLNNRTRIESQLRVTVATAQRHNRPLSFVLVDIDRFRTFNDVAGHIAGDMVLQDVARRVMGDIRLGDMAGRWGGDQFIVVLPETDLRGSRVLAERLRLSICEFGVEMPDSTMRPMSASFGCAEGSDFDVMLRDATKALAASKKAGGNTSN